MTALYSPGNGFKVNLQEFYETRQKVVNNINRHNHVIVAGNFNDLVGNSPIRSTREMFPARHRDRITVLIILPVLNDFILCRLT